MNGLLGVGQVEANAKFGVGQVANRNQLGVCSAALRRHLSTLWPKVRFEEEFEVVLQKTDARYK